MSQSQKKTGRLIGDPTKDELIDRFIRVDHAGEYGAKRIYEGQLAILGDSDDGDVLREMAVAEERHLATFDKLIVERRVRPSAFVIFLASSKIISKRRSVFFSVDSAIPISLRR